VTGDDRMVLPYKQKDWDNFRFSLDADSKLLAILPMNKAAVFKASDFNEERENIANANTTGDDYTFSMEVLDKKIDDEDDISELLGVADDNKTNINKVFPNPFRSEFTIDFEAEKDTEIEIMVNDISGRAVYNAKESLSEGQHNLKVNIPENQLANGAYILRVVDMEGFVQTRQLIRNAGN